VAVIEPARHYEAPLLGDLLEAALAGVHLKVVYDSTRSVISERVIYPFGVYASQGFWYCFCHDYRPEENVTLRADRFRNVEPAEGSMRSDVRAWGFLVSAYSAGEFFCACNEQKITKSAYTCR
jgi:predicted DNA-binding transcriptional regulator YafY